MKLVTVLNYTNGNLGLGTREKIFAEKLHNKDNTKIYHHGFTSIDEKCYIQCLECSSIYQVHCQVVRQKSQKIKCKKCDEIKRQQRLEDKKRQSEIIRQQKLEQLQKDKKLKTLLNGKQLLMSVCIVCNKLFIGNAKYCSNRCMERRHEHKKSRERKERAKRNGNIDKLITLEKIIQRDNNICYICNKPCDENDFYYKDNYFIAGNNYPSIDHVIPIAKGGTHTWDNVKLAHRLCNSYKSDKDIRRKRTT